MKIIGAFSAVALCLSGAMLLWGPSPEPAKVAFAGCKRATVGPVCYLKPSATLALWVEGAPFDELDVRLNETPLKVVTATVSGGVQIRVQPGGTGTLSMLMRREGRTKSFRLEVQRFEKPQALPGMRSIKTTGDLLKLEQVAASRKGRDAIVTYLRLGTAALRIGDPDRSVEYQARAADLAAAAGEWSLESRARFARAYNLTNILFRIEEGERELSRLEPLKDNLAEVAAYLPYYRSLIHTSVGDTNAALGELR